MENIGRDRRAAYRFCRVSTSLGFGLRLGFRVQSLGRVTKVMYGTRCSRSCSFAWPQSVHLCWCPGRRLMISRRCAASRWMAHRSSHLPFAHTVVENGTYHAPDYMAFLPACPTDSNGSLEPLCVFSVIVMSGPPVLVDSHRLTVLVQGPRPSAPSSLASILEKYPVKTQTILKPFLTYQSLVAAPSSVVCIPHVRARRRVRARQ